MAYSEKEIQIIKTKVTQLFNIVNELENTFIGRKFTLDGHLIGSIGEVLASYHYGLTLLPNSNEKHDAKDSGNRLIQIKATQIKAVGISDEPDYLIVLEIDRKAGKANEIYNGPGGLVWNACGKMQKNGHRQISLNRLKKLMINVNESDKIKLIHEF